MQVVLESRGECAEAQRLLSMIKSAFPEVLTAIKTKQLAQEILLNKEEHIGEVAKTGAIKRHCPRVSNMRLKSCNRSDCLIQIFFICHQ